MIANLGLTETARRLAVVIVEDAFLHPNYPLITWLMLAGTEFAARREHVEGLLQVLFDICSVGYKDDNDRREELQTP
jgi:hypothetical protein